MNNTPMTPKQALDLLAQVSKLPELRLPLNDHALIQQALTTLRPLVEPAADATAEI